MLSTTEVTHHPIDISNADPRLAGVRRDGPFGVVLSLREGLSVHVHAIDIIHLYDISYTFMGS